VGDVQFQKKCLGKMEDVSEREGRTVIFVSHDMAAISALTTKCIYLKKGQMELMSNTPDVIRHYLHADAVESGLFVDQKPSSKPQVVRAQVITSEVNYIHENGRDLRVDIDVLMPYSCEGMALSFQIMDDREIPVIFGYVFDADSPVMRTPGLHKASCLIPHCDLYEGNYYLRIHLAESKGREKFQEVDRVCKFEVKMMGRIIEWGWQKNVCVYTPGFNWTIKNQ
jgi:lipopolysaccharide transport system ATP-binding protein